MKRRCCITIPPSAAGRQLAEFLAGRFSYLRQGEWVDAIAGSRVLVNGDAASGDRVLRSGDTVSYIPGDAAEPPVDAAFDILFEDEALLAVNKPGNLPCHPAGRYFRHTLWGMLKARREGEELLFVHRLDRETSGVVLIAKTAPDAAALGKQMAAGGIRKQYAALVEGRFPEGPVIAEGALASDGRSVIRKKLRFFPVSRPEGPAEDAKACTTRFHLLRSGGALSMVAAVPVTGRRHQIRATLSGLGFPVVGDKIYGVDDTLFVRFIEGRLTDRDRLRLRMDRQALHAMSLEFHHPRTGRPQRIEAPLPDVFLRQISGDC